MRVKRSAITITTAALLLTACGGGADEGGNEAAAPVAEETAEGGAQTDEECADSLNVRIGHQVAEDAPLNQGAIRLGEILDEQSDGRITTVVHPSAQLGSEDELLQQNASGALEISIAGPPAMSNFHPDAAILLMPYSLQGDTEAEQYETLRNVVDDDVIVDITEEMAADHGFRPLDWTWWYGNRHVTNSQREINSPEDLAGLRLRTPDAAIHFLALDRLGASTTPLAFGELYLALELGTVDGQENPINIILAQQFAEVQDHLALTGHMSQAMTPVVSERFFASLCESDQQLLMDAARQAGEYQSELALDLNESGVEALRDAGMTVTEPDLGPFRDATEGAAEAWADENPNFSLERYEAFISGQEG